MTDHAFLGIDVSKGYADFLLLDRNKRALEEPFQLEDTLSGRELLEELIGKWFGNGITELNCGVESTGGYENNWYNYLQKLSRVYNLKVARLNAKGVKSVSDASLKRTITDEVSAENIAIYLMSFPDKVKYEVSSDEQQVFKERRQHYTYIWMLLKQKTQLNNQLDKLLYQFFSEMLIYCRHGMPVWLLGLLSRYPSAQAVKKAGCKRIAALPGITIDKANTILAKCRLSQQSVGIQAAHTMQVIAREILHKNALIKAEKQYHQQEVKDDPQIKLLRSIPGIGVDCAVVIHQEIEDVARFATVKKLTANFGVHPIFKQSGDGTWAVHMSKKGRAGIRAVLYMAALSAIRVDPSIKQLYARFRAKGMNHYQAIGIVMHKLLRICYGVLKNQTPYDSLIDKKNQDKAALKRNEASLKKNEQFENQTKKNRFQKVSVQAPVSRIKANKISKQAAYQSSNTEENAGLPPASIS